MGSLFEESDVEVEIDFNKVFQFPNDVVIRKFDDKNLVIYTRGVLWLVFSDDELAVFNSIKSGLSIAEVLEKYDEEIVIEVLSQIEAKQFEHPIIHESSEKNIYIYLTNNCNERCKHCYMYAGDIQIHEMPLNKWKKVLLDYKQNGGKGVTFTGGEVTVYKGFQDLLSYAHNLGLSITVLTNGILWDDSKIAACSSMIDEVQVSIDGYDKDSYFNVRQYDGFDQAVSTLIKFSEAGTRTSMAVTPLYDDLNDFVLHFEPFARQIIEQYPNIFIRFNLELLDGRDVRKTQIKNAEYRKVIRSLVEKLYPDYYLETFPLNYENHIIRKNCGFGEIAIAANGDVYWCNRIHELSSKWNVNTSTFNEIFKASENIKILTDVDHTLPCKNCEVKYICGGDCRMNYPEIMDVDTHNGLWQTNCPTGTKESLFQKMILCNEYFFMDTDEG